MKTSDIKHDPSINPREPSMPWVQRELLQTLRRFNLVKGEGCPRTIINNEAYADLDQHGWVERDADGFVYITNKGLEALKRAEEIFFPVRNVKRCDYCHGPIDKYEHLFQCRACNSHGDLNTGIMTPPVCDDLSPREFSDEEREVNSRLR
jgi:hypothetical protein